MLFELADDATQVARIQSQLVCQFGGSRTTALGYFVYDTRFSKRKRTFQQAFAQDTSVINIGSTITSVTPPATVVYAATKGAVDTITRVLAKELGPRKIRVNSINPGMVETEGVHALGILGSDFEKDAIAQTPLGRIGQPGDIAPAVGFLASPDSAWITGEILQVAGGLR
jgi:NAD(P)-dependent dehydrogenase (short-subunit alcohol dehydrogenase family)